MKFLLGRVAILLIFWGLIITVGAWHFGEPKVTALFAGIIHSFSDESKQASPKQQKPSNHTPQKTVIKRGALSKNGASKIVAIAESIANGKRLPYSWGGGHGDVPGASLGTCSDYHGSRRPCPADTTVGLDCSGLTRLVYFKAFGQDVLGSGPAKSQPQYMKRVSADERRPGDLVFFGGSTVPSIDHVAVWIGGGKIVEEPFTGGEARVYRLANKSSPVQGYYRFVP